MFALASIIALAFASTALAQPGPLTPLAVPEGQPCTITWTADATGKWTQTNIQLMSGDNDNMVPLTTIATVDTTAAAATTYSWTCPDVTIYAAIYFYQFSHSTEPDNLIWTTRFAIESAAGATVPAPNATQPDGSAIAWGNGQLKDTADAKPAPSYITGQPGTASTTNSTTPAISTTGSSSIASVSSSSAASLATVVTKVGTTTSASATSAAATSSTTGTTGTASTSGAGLSRSQGSIAVAAFGAVIAGVLAVM